MLTSEFDYNLPKELIAQKPAEPRDTSRLMVLDKGKKTVEHRYFYNLIDYLRQGDLLVWNVSKVFNARLRGVAGIEKKRAEIFLLRPTEEKGVWRVMAKPAKKLSVGMEICFANDFECEVILKEADGTLRVRFGDDEKTVRAKANKYGEVPTPPYIRNSKLEIRHRPRRGPALWRENLKLGEQYQTVYAKQEGSVAAPTAGLHFTPELIKKIKDRGVESAEVVLHVGLGTFQPVKAQKIEEHKMHAEWVELSKKNAKLINKAKAEGRRVIAVGTTTVRTLEGICQKFQELKTYRGDINIFITPGFKFQIIDALITNFHLPKSTLLMLVSAFVNDKKFLFDCYQEAINKKYRFFSFGDAMMIK